MGSTSWRDVQEGMQGVHDSSNVQLCRVPKPASVRLVVLFVVARLEWGLMLSEHASLWSPYIDCVSCCYRIPIRNDHQVHPPRSLQGRTGRQLVRWGTMAEGEKPTKQAFCIHAQQLALSSCACVQSFATKYHQPLAEGQPL